MKILFISLGCDKNLADSETMLGLLASRGYQIVDTEEDADVIIVNTCCFIHDAMEESIETILQMAEYKKSGSLKALIVTGCMAERYRRNHKGNPGSGRCHGTASYRHILDAVTGALAGNLFKNGAAGYTSSCEYSSHGDDRRALCVSQDCGRMR